MAQLTTIDMALINDIFGMYSGYVLDFSNDRFAAFFNRDLKIDIYTTVTQYMEPRRGSTSAPSSRLRRTPMSCGR
jgi:hypothetical protein